MFIIFSRSALNAACLISAPDYSSTIHLSCFLSFSFCPSVSLSIPLYLVLRLSDIVCLSVLSFSAAKSKPVVAEPEIHGSQALDDVTGFLLLMSEGLINALESAHGPEQANQVGGFSPTSSSHLEHFPSISRSPFIFDPLLTSRPSSLRRRKSLPW